jgi:allantoinase
VDWAAWGGVVPGNAEALEPLVAAGVPGFKCFLIDSGIAGFKWVNEDDLREALGKLHGIELPLLAHAEVAGPVETATRELNAATADWRKYAKYLASRPDAAETQAIEMLIRLAGEFGAPVHIVHLASAEALPMLTEARRWGLPITIETCVHYLWFAAEEIANGATEYKCAPPIRSAANREALWNALERGLIDMVTTDHSPCPPAMKCRDEGRFDKAWGGIASLGLALPVMWTAMKRRGIALEHVGEWMAEAPARLADLEGQKGVIDAGADADFAVFDPDADWTVTESDLSFRHKISPYLGAKLFGRVRETWLRGELVYRADEFVGEARGREQARL